MSFQTRYAGVVVAFEVIERLVNPAEVLAACRSLLKPGGIVVLTSPNYMGFDVMIVGSKSYQVDPSTSTTSTRDPFLYFWIAADSICGR